MNLLNFQPCPFLSVERVSPGLPGLSFVDESISASSGPCLPPLLLYVGREKVSSSSVERYLQNF